MSLSRSAWLDAILHDVRYAARTLRRAPGFTLVAIATLALGIGCTTAVFSVVDAIVLRGLPYRDPGALRTVYEANDDGNLRTPSYPTFEDWQTQSAAVRSTIAGVSFVRGDLVTLPAANATDTPDRRIAAYVTPGFFQLMGTRPALGRLFASDEELAGGARVAVISWDLFIDRFGADRQIIGHTIAIDSIPTTIIGVMPHAFGYPNFGAGGSGFVAPALWQPIAIYTAAHPQLALRGLHVDSRTVLRLQPGADSARAAAVMRTIERRLALQYPAEQAHWTNVSLQSLGEEMYGSVRSALVIVAGAIVLVLLLACANVANLLLVRGSVRARELALRAALGASRLRLARELLVESVLLAVGAGAAGLALAAALVAFVRHAASANLPFAAELRVSVRTAVFAIAASLVTALLIGLAPAFQAGAGQLMNRMRSGGSAAVGGMRERRLRHGLVSLQFALAIMLLIGAGLLLQSFRRLASVPLGYDPAGVVEFAIAPETHRYDAPEQAAALYSRILDVLRAIPGVTSAAAAGGALIPTNVETERASTGRAPDQALYHPVSTDYLKTMRVPLLAGRWFTDGDMRSPDGFVINQKLARQLWPDASPLGRRLTVHRSSQARADFGQPITMPVIGVVGDMRQYGPAEKPENEVFLPYTLEVWPWMTFVMRSPDAAQIVKQVRPAVRAVEPALDFREEPNVQQTGAAAIDPQRRFLTLVLAGFAAGALLLAAVGLYSIVAYGVVQRTRELGVRIALGASEHSVQRLVLRDGAMFVLAGAVLGIIGAWFSTRLIRSLLFDTTSTDIATFIAVPVLLAIVALLASWLPARRAAHTDPLVAIRAE